jgi:hypothetical protein
VTEQVETERHDEKRARDENEELEAKTPQT